MAAAIIPGRREAGLLLHPTSLPSGQLDVDAFRWLDGLAAAGISVWQMLPLGVPLTGLSPYQCASAFAINPALFPQPEATFANGRIDMEAFDRWYQQNAEWVDAYALFMELKAHHGGAEWMHWPAEYRRREPQALEMFQLQHATALDARVCQQFEYWQHWQELRAYANSRDIRLFGDIPIFVAHDSADVWSKPELFLLNEDGQPTVVTGVPPDYFSETGQRWGNPHYNWEAMQATDFHWWRERLRYHFDFFDLVRIDHFRGLEAAWTIPADCPTAIDGHWEPVPGDLLLERLQRDAGALPLVAEDLGVITPEVTALRLKYQLPGMSVLQFGFDHFEDNPHKPHNVTKNTVYYTGTHDNDTLMGWFENMQEEQQAYVQGILASQSPLNEGNITNMMLETVMNSAAGLVMLPWQDLLGLGSEARMNIPGTVEGNWQWRFEWSMLPEDLIPRLHDLLERHQRLNLGAPVTP